MSEVRILYVDPDEDAGTRVATAFDEVSVRTAATGGDALSALEEGSVDCLISEYTLPDGDGIDLLETVRERGMTVPFVLYTDAGSEDVASAAITAGVTEYVRKTRPDSLSALQTAVEDVLRERTIPEIPLRKADELRTLVEDVTDHAIFLLDREGHVASWNSGAENIKGYTRDEILGEHFSVFYPEDEVERGTPDGILVRTRAHGGAEVEGWRVRKDGSRFWADIVITALEDEEGNVRGFAKFTRDVTEQRRREERLRREYELTDRILNAVPVAVAVHDSNGNLVRANARGEDLLDISTPDAESEPPEELDVGLYEPGGTPVDDADRPIQRVFATGESVFDRELVVERSNGSRVYISVNSVPLYDEDGEIERTVTAAQDVTDLKERQRELERSNAELEEFAYAVSHDLKEPLRTVTSYLQLIERRYGEALDEDAAAFIEYAVDGAERMRRMIDDLLAYSRVGRGESGFEPIDTRSVVEDVFTSLPDTETATLTLGDLPTVAGNRTQLTKLFQNLISNAIKYDDSDSVTVHVDATRRGDWWRIAVSDDGPGILPEYHDRVFDLFTSIGGKGGTGVGLSICRKVVEGHGGEIWIESEPGEGTTFFFTLPAVGAVEDAPSG